METETDDTCKEKPREKSCYWQKAAPNYPKSFASLLSLESFLEFIFLKFSCNGLVLAVFVVVNI